MALSTNLRNSSLERISLRRLLRVCGGRIGVAEHGGRHEEELGVGVVRLDALHELDHGGREGGGVEGSAGVQVAEVVGAEVDDDGVGSAGRGEGVAVVGVVGAVAGVELWHQGACVGASAGVVAGQAFAAPGYDAVVCAERGCGQSLVGFWVVFQGGGVCAGVHAVEPVADGDGVTDDLNLALRGHGGLEGAIGGDGAEEDGAHIGLGTLA